MNEYTCALCHNEYTSDRTRSDALLEAELIGFDLVDLVTVCEPCHADLVRVSQQLGFMDEDGRLTERGAALQRNLTEQGEEE